jgi:methylenetetrahydrofolate reductase (NADPH)
LTVSAPDRLVAALGKYQATHPNCGIVTAHIYPLGGLAKSAHWSYAVADGRFRLNATRDGFTIDDAA